MISFTNTNHANDSHYKCLFHTLTLTLTLPPLVMQLVDGQILAGGGIDKRQGRLRESGGGGEGEGGERRLSTLLGFTTRGRGLHRAGGAGGENSGKMQDRAVSIPRWLRSALRGSLH